MNAFIVELPNRPGELARVTEALAERQINITGFTGSTCGDSGSVCLLTNDEAATRRALQDGGYTMHERELVVAILGDRPGTMADAARRLADAGVNIEAAMPIGMSADGVNIAFATDDATRARAALAGMATTGVAGA